MSKTRAPFIPRRRLPRPRLVSRPAPGGALPFDRRSFLGSLLAGAALAAVGCDKDDPPAATTPSSRGVSIAEVRAGEDLFGYVVRVRGGHDEALYKAILGAANEYKEGDEALGIHALDQATRDNARALLGNTRLGDLRAHPLHRDAVLALIEGAVDEGAAARVAGWTMAELREFLLREDEPAIKAVMVGLSSEIIGMIVKLMTNDELIAVSRKVFNPLPGSNIGARGYLGARIQPNSPTDNVDDIVWQVFSGWSYAVGDVVLGNNPVSSEVDSVAAIELALKDVLVTFGLQDTLPHCVLAHIDVQAAAEGEYPGSTALWFQSLGSTDDANATFDVSVDKMLAHAAQRGGKFGLYFETGQGADATNGHGAGFDMVVHEARKYGFARALTG
ncbi:MAG TPA: ethanolamine ammonia-lyase subunit EutB, partial [Polyangiaceae bacterium]|nr:ethanolamine ammonia-lyase subunit EutB [Polyangiaceae bacterium]